MALVDTIVLVDVLRNDPQWADWSIAQMRAQAQRHALAIELLDDVVLSIALELREMPRPALVLAAKAFAQ